MSITIKSGSTELCRLVDLFFKTYYPNDGTAVRVGWKERAKQINKGEGGANRIVLIPSDDSGKAGKLGPARGPGYIPKYENGVLQGAVRSIASHLQLWTCSVWAIDRAAPEDEGAQIAATEQLLERAIQAIHHAGLADFERTGDVSWTTSPVEKLFGKECRFTFTFRAPIFDVPQGVAFPDHEVPRPDHLGIEPEEDP